MIFKQLLETVSSTYTYLIACRESGKTLLIDPVLETVERDLDVINNMGLRLDMHLQADHLTGSRKLKALSGSTICGPAVDELRWAGKTPQSSFKLRHQLRYIYFSDGKLGIALSAQN